jgi:two-component system chemotaxis sensor kinase CheA
LLVSPTPSLSEKKQVDRDEKQNGIGNEKNSENASPLTTDASVHTDNSAMTKTLRVEQASIDKLGDLIGELVVAKNAMPYLAQRAERDFGVSELAKLLKEQFNVIDRLTQELQGTIMKVQMLPVSQIFQRFPRLVRDISRKLGKKINLVIEGEETQADKTVIELMSDPMIHMVRNSLDHGLETPEERLAMGKAVLGTLKLKAYQEGDSVIIEIQDDGRGIDPVRVKHKAIEKGIITSEQAETMPDQEAIYLIFQPGFSTNDEVTDLSGRGVGMDVVRSTIERIGGGLKVSSEVGRGTMIKLSLPLSMAVSHVMEIELADQVFGIPMDLVVETTRLQPERIKKIKQRETFVWRSRILPLVRLRNSMQLAGGEKRLDGSESVLVVRRDSGLIGLVVDDFRSKSEVIMKPLEGPLAQLSLYSGSALLGDGSVMLVINIAEVPL